MHTELLATQIDSTASLEALDTALKAEEVHGKLRRSIQVQLMYYRELSFGQRRELEDEVYASVLNRAVENRRCYDASRSKASTWLNGITLNVVKEQVRQLRRNPRTLTDESPRCDSFLARTDEQIEQLDNLDWFEAAKRQLSMEDQELLEMTRQGMDGKAMAAQLGISRGATRVRVSRMLNKLKQIHNAQYSEERS
jgi:RNA polymerase sigma factor (sigma-70 family)